MMLSCRGGVRGTRFSKGCQNFSEQTPSGFLFRHHRAGSHLLAPLGIMGWSSVVQEPPDHSPAHVGGPWPGPLQAGFNVCIYCCCF